MSWFGFCKSIRSSSDEMLKAIGRFRPYAQKDLIQVFLRAAVEVAKSNGAPSYCPKSGLATYTKAFVIKQTSGPSFRVTVKLTEGYGQNRKGSMIEVMYGLPRREKETVLKVGMQKGGFYVDRGYRESVLECASWSHGILHVAEMLEKKPKQPAFVLPKLGLMRRVLNKIFC